MIEKDFKQIFPLGEKNDAYVQYFVGQSYLSMLTTGRVGIANVTFEPGCGNNRHIHHAKSGGGDIYYTLTYDSNGGTEYASERYPSNTLVQLDKNPVREGYTFTGFYILRCLRW